VTTATLNVLIRLACTSAAPALGQASLLRLEADSGALQLSTPFARRARRESQARADACLIEERRDSRSASDGVRLLTGAVHVSPARGQRPQ
jgi:hypothetical protein